jgi:hypothetical protein
VRDFLADPWSRIIDEAAVAVSPVGIGAIVVVIAGFVVIGLVRPADRATVWLAVIVLLTIFCFGLVGIAIYGVRPRATAASDLIWTPDLEIPPQVTERIPSSSPSSKTAVANSVARSANAQAGTPKLDCGTAWSAWTDAGGGVDDPCPTSCSRGEELGLSYRRVGFPPRPQTKHKFQCWRS